MDGDIPKPPESIEIKKRHAACLFRHAVLPPAPIVLADDVARGRTGGTTDCCSNRGISADDGAEHGSAGSANGSTAEGFLLCARHSSTSQCAGKSKNNKSERYAFHFISPSNRHVLKGLSLADDQRCPTLYSV